MGSRYVSAYGNDHLLKMGMTCLLQQLPVETAGVQLEVDREGDSV